MHKGFETIKGGGLRDQLPRRARGLAVRSVLVVGVVTAVAVALP